MCLCWRTGSCALLEVCQEVVKSKRRANSQDGPALGVLQLEIMAGEIINSYRTDRFPLLACKLHNRCHLRRSCIKNYVLYCKTQRIKPANAPCEVNASTILRVSKIRGITTASAVAGCVGNTGDRLVDHEVALSDAGSARTLPLVVCANNPLRAK